MELKTRKYVIDAEFLNGEIKTFEFDELHEALNKKSELSANENVVSMVYRKTATYSRREDPFNNQAKLDTIRRSFRDYCYGKNCALCRYNNASHCEFAFFIDHYEAKDGDANEN